jgi:hypothetical protein
MDTNLIPLKEYAERVGRDPATVRQKILRRMLPGAVKLGRDWLIPEGTPYEDKRIRTGSCRNWRKKSE